MSDVPIIGEKSHLIKPDAVAACPELGVQVERHMGRIMFGFTVSKGIANTGIARVGYNDARTARMVLRALDAALTAIEPEDSDVPSVIEERLARLAHYGCVEVYVTQVKKEEEKAFHPEYAIHFFDGVKEHEFMTLHYNFLAQAVCAAEMTVKKWASDSKQN